MKNVFENLNIQRIILHEIYQRDTDRKIVTPKYSDTLTELEAAGKANLCTRIVKALGASSSGIAMEIEKTSAESCFQLSAKVMKSDQKTFIKESVHFASKLADAQVSRQIPGGKIVVIKATIGASSKDCLIIIKAEQQTGFASEEDEHSIKMKFLDNLLLTPQQKLYKIGVFIEKTANEPVKGQRSKSDFLAFVYDHNMTLKDERKAASYFYDAFLGMSIPEDSKIQTRHFYEYTKQFINDSNLTDEQKVDLSTSLYVYLKNDQSSVIESGGFSNSYIPETHRSSYLSYLESKGFSSNAINKDLSLIASYLKQRKITFSSKVKILAPAEDFANLVKIVKTKNDTTHIEIKGRISSQE